MPTQVRILPGALEKNLHINQKGFTNTALIVLMIAVLGIVGYFILSNKSPVSGPIPPTINETPTNWQFINAGSFTLSLPPNWKFNKLQGIDSYVGEFVGDDMKLHFDFGWYSNSLTEDSDPSHIVTYETIGGYETKIIIPKIAGDGITGVYFDNIGGKFLQKQQTRFNLYGENFTSSQQETALKIFRTLKIVKQTWP